MAEEPYSVQSKPPPQHRHPPHHHHHHSHNNHVMLHGHHHHHQIHPQQQQQQQQQIHSPSSIAAAAATNREVGQTVDRFPVPQGNRGLSLSLQHKNALSLPPQHELAARVAPAGTPTTTKARADGGAAGHGRDDAWTESATLALIDAWGERYLHLNRGNLKQKHWREVAEEVTKRSSGGGGGGGDENPAARCGKSDVQCKNRLDTLKKKYKIEKTRLGSGDGCPSKWPFFAKLDELIGPSKKGKKRPPPPPPPLLPTSVTPPIPSLPPPLLPPQSMVATPMDRDREISKLQAQIDRHQQQQQQQATSNDSSSREVSAGMTDSCENAAGGGGGAATANGGGRGSSKRRKVADGSLRELARAIVKFGEVYERIESAKQQQLMDLERQRMEFTKDLELQRMQLYMQTKVEVARMKHDKLGGGGGGGGGGGASGGGGGNTEHFL